MDGGLKISVSVAAPSHEEGSSGAHGEELVPADLLSNSLFVLLSEVVF